MTTRETERDDGSEEPWATALDRTGRGWTGVRELVRLATSPEAWHGEVPPAIEGLDGLSRRGFFRLVGVGAAAAGLSACSSRPSREIRPYAHQPPEVTPGIPLHYATAHVEDGFATGVLVASHEGRPTKIEGNPDHPASLGATRAIEQAAVLSLYDPQRTRYITGRGAPAAWSEIERLLGVAAARGGAGLQLVLEPTSSPIIADLVTRIRATLPAARTSFWSPFEPRASLVGNRLAFGRALQTQLDLRTADVIVTLDADITNDHPMSLALSRQISDRRRVVDADSVMNRLYAVEPTYTTTGVVADHRLRVRGSEIEQIALELLAQVIGRGRALAGAPPVRPGASTHARWVAAVARDLASAPGRSAVIAGERQSPAVHAIAAAINLALDNVGRTVSFTEPVVFEAGTDSHELVELAGAIARNEVTTLLVLGGNPAYTAPADLDLARAIARVPDSLYLGLYANETAAVCRYVVPALHGLEEWGVARAYDGTLTPIQPLIDPLFDGHSPSDLLHALLGDPSATAHDRMRAAWRQVSTVDLDAALSLGMVSGTAAPHVAVTPMWNVLGPVVSRGTGGARSVLELDVRPHPFVFDGRYTNNPWLLELPEPITKLTWDNAAMVSPKTASGADLESGDLVALTVDGHTLEVPVVVVPGQADGAITLQTGFGRTGDEQVARGVGVNAFALWTRALGFQPSVTLVKRAGHRALAITQDHWRMDHRPIVLAGTPRELRDTKFRGELAKFRGPVPTLYTAFPANGSQWGMSIDLTTCTGCSACVMACVAENNTPVVGRGQVLRSREMHWLRIDRYFEGPTDEPTIDVQPMACQHCETAPCEYVCPVEATTHSPDGLNEMTYNRCIGTRFCSNNCPYKVRRFNWFDFKQHDSLQIAARNPDVTVRDRGVMEKCTYCVQRIRRVEIDARIAGRPIGHDEVRTACQQACPTQAIVFGSISDPSAQVTELHARSHSYAVLHDQGTRPRTMYLAKLRNPNPELE